MAKPTLKKVADAAELLNHKDEKERAPKRLRTSLPANLREESDADNIRQTISGYDRSNIGAKKFNSDSGLPPYTDTLYLDTINRKLLDFDFEKICSQTLSNQNIYACLVCGRYFRGRTRETPAFFHALDEDHHIFVNIQTLKFVALPENYEIKSHTLDDIKYNICPTFTDDLVKSLDFDSRPAQDLELKKFYPGFVGLNNIEQNDYLNVVVQALVHVKPLRNILLIKNLYKASRLVQQFSLLCRKLWNRRAFKSHASPHEILQEITNLSKKRFTLNKQSDPADFLGWFMNHLHLGLGGSNVPGSSLIHKFFQGKLRIESQEISIREGSDRLKFETSLQIDTKTTQFMFLSLDMPPKPLFVNEFEASAIPQINLEELIQKYNGIRAQELAGQRRRYKIISLPPFLIFHIKRFNRGNYGMEHNPTIVNFKSTNLDLSMLAGETSGSAVYDLVANITLESISHQEVQKHIYRCQVQNEATKQWYQMQDLYVEHIPKEMISLGESYIQIWGRVPNEAAI